MLVSGDENISRYSCINLALPEHGSNEPGHCSSMSYPLVPQCMPPPPPALMSGTSCTIAAGSMCCQPMRAPALAAAPG